MILILTHTNGFEPDIVIDHLIKMELPFVRLNFDLFPIEKMITIKQNNNKNTVIVDLVKNKFDISEIKAAWFHEAPIFRFAPEINDNVALSIIKDETMAFMEGIWGLMKDKWINNPGNIRKASNKIIQMEIAKNVGLNVPPSIITNDPNEAIEFCKLYNDDVIIKDLNYVPREVGGAFIGSFTKKLSMELKKDYSSVHFAPVQLQCHIKKSYEMRITIVGDKIFTAALDSQAYDVSKTDWRRYNLDKPMKKWTEELPKDISVKCVELLRCLDIEFGAIDMIVSPEKEYYFLEINTTGAWGWLERDLGLPISKAFADLLGHLVSQ